MNRYARKFIMLPIMPAQEYWLPQIRPKGAARLVTKEIIAKRNIIVIMAMMLL